LKRAFSIGPRIVLFIIIYVLNFTNLTFFMTYTSDIMKYLVHKMVKRGGGMTVQR